MFNLRIGDIDVSTKLKLAVDRCKATTNITIFTVIMSIIVATFHSSITGLAWTIFVAAIAFVAGGGCMFLLIFDKEAK